MDANVNETDAALHRVQDVYLAAYFHCLAYPLKRIENVSPNSKFYFGGIPEGKEFDYYNSAQEEVSPCTFFESFKIMRSVSSHVEVLDDYNVGVRDIYLAAYLYYKELKIVRVEPADYLCRFVFEPEALEAAFHFYNRETEVLQIKKLMQSLRNVRDLSAPYVHKQHAASL